MENPPLPFRVTGVDLAAQPERTALCELEIRPGRQPWLAALTRGVTNQDIVDAALRSDLVAIDAPFGWPDPFIDFLVNQRTRGPHQPPLQDPREIWFRRTDIMMTPLKMPLSVASDRIARTAYRAMGVLEELANAGIAIDRSGVTGKVIEVYPGAGLMCWGPLPSPSYKGTANENRASCRSLAEALVTALGGVSIDSPADSSVVARLSESDDHLDAFVCALIAGAKIMGEVVNVPCPGDEDHDRATREGWIYLPTHEALAGLGAAPL